MGPFRPASPPAGGETPVARLPHVASDPGDGSALELPPPVPAGRSRNPGAAARRPRKPRYPTQVTARHRESEWLSRRWGWHNTGPWDGAAAHTPSLEWPWRSQPRPAGAGRDPGGPSSPPGSWRRPAAAPPPGGRRCRRRLRSRRPRHRLPRHRSLRHRRPSPRRHGRNLRRHPSSRPRRPSSRCRRRPAAAAVVAEAAAVVAAEAVERPPHLHLLLHLHLHLHLHLLHPVSRRFPHHPTPASRPTPAIA